MKDKKNMDKEAFLSSLSAAVGATVSSAAVRHAMADEPESVTIDADGTTAEPSEVSNEVLIVGDPQDSGFTLEIIDVTPQDGGSASIMIDDVPCVYGPPPEEIEEFPLFPEPNPEETDDAPSGGTLSIEEIDDIICSYGLPPGSDIDGPGCNDFPCMGADFA